jgi:hypothetical protein
MQLTMFEQLEDVLQPSSSGRTCQESSQQPTTPLAAFLEHLPEKMSRSSRQGANGRTLVVCMAPKEQSRGESLMPNISEWPNAAAVCSLSQVLETGLIPQRFFLSSTACAGILRRAEKRGKELPTTLRHALQAVAAARNACASASGRMDFETETFLVQPVAFHPTQDPISSTDGTTHGLGCGSSGGQASVAVAMRESGQGYWMQDDIAGTLRAEGEDRPSRPSHVIGVPPAMQVRRITPMEAERLMGFPDNYTAIPWRKKPASECPDGPRYKALGNSWAVPVVAWIGKRIAGAL